MTEIEIIREPISAGKLKELAGKTFGDMIKCVADLEKGIMAVGAELHADEEEEMMGDGSAEADLWGFNIHVNEPRQSWLEFNSMVNIRPEQGNLTRTIQDPEIQQRIREIVDKLIQ